MRTTLDIEDDVLPAVKEQARRQAYPRAKWSPGSCEPPLLAMAAMERLALQGLGD